ncbi:hypothetical protein [Nonomuraea indica]|uniref:hypothetical protein n=1 Tax=Nonomuraea indica TaxID=1581193 RepID=UPI000C7E3FAA|nr:hypothetical protein [Nonomuraea indica]
MTAWDKLTFAAEALNALSGGTFLYVVAGVAILAAVSLLFGYIGRCISMGVPVVNEKVLRQALVEEADRQERHGLAGLHDVFEDGDDDR